MKKACLYILFFIVFLNYTSLNQFFKLPFLIAHFIEHHQQDRTIGLTEFISMHYCGNDMDDNDEDRDMQLPYKKVDHQSVKQPVFPLFKLAPAKHPSYLVSIDKALYKDDYLPQPALTSLFRPPKA